MKRKTPVPMTTPFDGYTEFNVPRLPRQTARLFTLRPNPLNTHEVNRIIDSLDAAIDEAFSHVA